MSKWIHGRRGRSIASILSGLVLTALLLSLAPPPVQAQPTTDEMNALFGIDIVKPVPVVVFDYTNRSEYKTGMPGRTFADALSIELLNTKKFAVVPRGDLETVLDQEGLSVPLSYNAQAEVAERLVTGDLNAHPPDPFAHPPYTITGEVEDVKIIRGHDGTYAEVTVSTLVMSKVTKLPINGARVVQRSSPKIGFTGNPDVLVQEALATAAYQTSYKLLSNRLPIATVLTSAHEGQVQLKGGSTIGLSEGMTLTTMRRGVVTGKIRLTMVDPSESAAEVLENRGLALGDKAVPIFELVPVARVSAAKREAAGLQAVSLIGLIVLAAWVGSDAGNNQLKASTTPSAVSLADAFYTNNTFGANLVRWSMSHRDKIVAYVIYRDTNPFAPIAVVSAEDTYYIDNATPLEKVGDVMENTQIQIQLDQQTGEVTFTRTVAFAQDFTDLQDPAITSTLQSYNITCRRVPLQPGQTTGYQVAVIYKDYDMTQQNNAGQLQYRLFAGAKSPASRRVTLLTPPTLDTPLSGVLPVDGNYRCATVMGASTYNLQVSPDSNFTPNRTVNITKNGQAGMALQVVDLPLQTLYDTFPSNNVQTLYWRIGARKDAEARPDYYSDPNQTGWVYSDVNSFDLPAVPPRSPRSGMQMGAPNKLPGQSGRENTGRLRILRR